MDFIPGFGTVQFVVEVGDVGGPDAVFIAFLPENQTLFPVNLTDIFKNNLFIRALSVQQFPLRNSDRAPHPVRIVSASEPLHHGNGK